MSLMRCAMVVMELPPRTRRIPRSSRGCTYRRGTTSAYAENTRPPGAWPLWAWNYLRVRGEYPISPTWVTKKEELPPRTRRILAGQGEPPAERGTTSAYAENTCRHVKLQRIIGNYLRVRGEYPPGAEDPQKWGELPPRTRRIQLRASFEEKAQGTTSACAENTK